MTTTLKNRQLQVNLAEGQMLNGKIVPTVSSNNLTLSLKTLAGANASTSDPIFVMINGVLRSITAALSVTKNAATNWCNAGSAELATKEIDYFAYLGYNATDGVVLGFSRIPSANQYSDFSTTTTNEKYCAISTITNAAATDYYNVIGRFAATLSAGAGYTWSVPTFTAINLIQKPAYETRQLIWTPTWTGFSPAPTGTYYYNITGRFVRVYELLTSYGTSNTAGQTITLPFSPSVLIGRQLCMVVDNNVSLSGRREVSGTNVVTFFKDLAGNVFTNSGNKWGSVGGFFFEI